ncbi:hypothetical protein CFP66_03650 [Pseudonocardia sp. MH-G8]|nr:hypothetical protein CFP66_03650 [Pseudonocardia sp. MH-G8]
MAQAVEALWDYHNLRHEPRRTDVGIGLGSHDLSVATTAAELYSQGMFPLIVFTGANSPTTAQRFPRGEAVHYREHAVALGVPADSILIDDAATNTGENITNTRALLADAGQTPRAVTLITRPYQQRRAYATCRKLWPDVEPVCAATPLPLADYIASIGDEARVINMLVGDTQRIDVYAERGFAIPQPMSDDVRDAMSLLVSEGYTQRLI